MKQSMIQNLFFYQCQRQRINGVIDLSIVDNVLKQINEINRSESNIVLLRSTVTPGTSEKIQKKYPNLRIVFNPGILTERSASFDFINQSRVILEEIQELTEKSEVFI